MPVTEIDPSQIVAPVNNPKLTPEEAAEGHDTVKMYFENPVRMIIDWQTQVEYPKGVHEVPRVWSNHWYLKAHGVTLNPPTSWVPARK